MVKENKTKSIVLGISAYYHDSAAVLVIDGVVVAGASEERFSRIKQDPAFPKNAIRFCLEFAKINPSDVKFITFYDKPLLKWERLIETYVANAPRGIKSFCSAMRVWIKEKLFFRSMISKELKNSGFNQKEYKLLFTEHHLSHAASAFYPSPFQSSAILTIDGVGEWATASIMKGDGAKIEKLCELRFPHSLGLLYSAFTYYLGFKVNSGEYKLMGLAPYGDPESQETSGYISQIKNNLIKIFDDGSIHIYPKYFNYTVGFTMANDIEWKKLFNLPKKKEGEDYNQSECNLALAIQIVTEEVVIKMAKHASKLTGIKNLCMAGGVALNCVANSKIKNQGIFNEIWVQPASGDAGGALGAALATYYMYLDNKRTPSEDSVSRNAYLGPEYEEWEVRSLMKKYSAPARIFNNIKEVSEYIANKLIDGKVVGWIQGRMEWGPRALGNRSILADARDPETQKKLNLKIKFREGFRPFAPIVLENYAKDFFEFDRMSPYMLFVAPVRKDRRIVLPKNYHSLSLREKLYFVRSDIPAVTHLDYSARLQTVSPKDNPALATLLDEFNNKTGYPILVNTSFNVRGEPIVCSPEDSYKCFMRTDIDYLVIGNIVFDKTEQPKLSKDILDFTYTPD